MSAMSASSPSSPTRSSRATPNGRPKKSPGAGRGNVPPPPAPGAIRAGPPMSNVGWAPAGFRRGPETYWKGAYWQPEEPSPYTNPGEMPPACTSLDRLPVRAGHGRCALCALCRVCG
jgi:hypothetical protein